MIAKRGLFRYAGVETVCTHHPLQLQCPLHVQVFPECFILNCTPATLDSQLFTFHSWNSSAPVGRLVCLCLCLSCLPLTLVPCRRMCWLRFLLDPAPRAASLGGQDAVVLEHKDTELGAGIQ